MTLDRRRYDSPLLSVDLTIFTLHEDRLKLLLVQRDAHPCMGQWGLPGGFVDMKRDQQLLDTAKRKLRDKTGVEAPLLEQVCTVGDARRDPRGWSVTVLYMALLPYAPTAIHVSTVRKVCWWPMDRLPAKLAFDHGTLIQLARERLKNKTAYTVLPLHVLEAPFSLTQLQRAFEQLLDTRLEKKSFRRRILNAGLLEEAGEKSPAGGRGRPAAQYRPIKGSDQHQFLRIFGQSGRHEKDPG